MYIWHLSIGLGYSQISSQEGVVIAFPISNSNRNNRISTNHNQINNPNTTIQTNANSRNKLSKPSGTSDDGTLMHR